MPHPINVRIEKLVYGGEGLAHHEGHTVFAPFVLPDESVSIEPVETRKKFIRGRVAQAHDLTGTEYRMYSRARV